MSSSAPGKYKIITTEDGTPSIFSEEYGEAMHSVSGAYEEALLKHVYPSRILDAPEDNLCVLDVGSGMGYNILALLREFRNKNSRQKLNIISLEKDFSYIPLLECVRFRDERDDIYESIKAAFKGGACDYGFYSITVIQGDARKSLSGTGGLSFNAVFHDPYSPSKNPELWSVQFFRMIYERMDGRGVLTTYSSAPQVRAALIEAGFRIGRGPSVGKKREGTIASIRADIEYMGDGETAAFKGDVKFTPYRDPGLSDSGDAILERRLEEMRILRSRIEYPIQNRQARQ